MEMLLTLPILRVSHVGKVMDVLTQHFSDPITKLD